MNRSVTVATAWLGSIARLGAGLIVSRAGARPEKPLELYEFEACPFCRKVREALSQLDLEAMVYPCPKDGTRFRPDVERLGGRLQFPYLVDPNTGVKLFESNDIVKYLFERYGTGAAPWPLRLGPLTTLSSMGASAVRLTRGGQARPSKAPGKPLELWSFEASPYCALVRERLCELELPYLVHNVAKRSPGREAFRARSGRMMVPWLADPNTGHELFESADIVAYLQETYGVSEAADTSRRSA